MPIDERDEVLRSPTARAIAVFYTAFVALAASLPWIDGQSTKSLVVAPVGVVFFGVLGVRAWRAGIGLDAKGVVGRTDRFTRRIYWSDIERFAVKSGGLGAIDRSGRWIRLGDYGIAWQTSQRHLAELQRRREHAE